MTPLQKTYAVSGRILNTLGYPIKVMALRNTKRVRVLIVCKGRVLLLRSSIGSQKWSMPGGAVERGEPLPDAAVREVREETALVLRRADLQLLGETPVMIPGTSFRYSVSFFIVTIPEIVEPKIIRPLEILESDWYLLNELPENHSPLLDQALQLAERVLQPRR